MWHNLKFPAAHVPEDRRCFPAFARFSPCLFHPAAKEPDPGDGPSPGSPIAQISLLSHLEKLPSEPFPARQQVRGNQSGCFSAGRGGATARMLQGFDQGQASAPQANRELPLVSAPAVKESRTGQL